MRSVLLTTSVVFIVLGITTSPALGDRSPTGVSYMLHESWGGMWSDAEKSRYNSEDDNMCWASAAANVLEWTGWGYVDGMANTDDMFGYFQDHWTDRGGCMPYGWQWWFTGANPSSGWAGWSQVDVAGGGFHPSQHYSSLYHYASNNAIAMASIDTYLRSGYGTTIGIYGPGGHAVTVWGFTHDADNPSEYNGLYVTDSDDYKYHPKAPDRLRYYEVEYSGGKWYLQSFYGSNDWYIGVVSALAPVPPTTPGDLNGDRDVDVEDIDLLAVIIRGENISAASAIYDLNDDGLVNGADMDKLVCDILGTVYGDANLDAIVNLSDFGILASSYGHDAGWRNGDFDGDGRTDATDFSLLADNYGWGALLSPGANAPEPSTSVLIALLAPLMLRRRSRKSRKTAGP